MVGGKRAVAVLAALATGALTAIGSGAPAGATPRAATHAAASSPAGLARSAAPAGRAAPSFAAAFAAAVRTSPHASAGSIDPYGPQGMNVKAAQSDYGDGDPSVIVAYVEGGINWYDGTTSQNLADSVYVNWHETPVPCSGSTMMVGGVTQACSTVYSSNEDDYDIVNADCVQNNDCDVDASDWASDPRVGRTPGLSFITPEDLIAAFSGPGFDPPAEVPAGYAHAISGWDFYDNQNDPATVDGAYQHSDDQMSVIHTLCPNCTILPVKAGDEAIDTTNDLAQAWLFAAESGARVIVSVTADLGYSTFARQVLAYIQSKGIVVVESSNDFDTPDHQGGMYWNGVLAGNGLVANTNGLPQSVWSQTSIPGPYWTRSDLTSWGPHAQFSVATGGGSTSESTPTLGGIVALLLSDGDAAYASHLIPAPLTGPQAVAVLESSSSEPPGAAAGAWDDIYGYGMPDELAAVQQVRAGDVPPAARITSPSWYQLYDPTHGGAITVAGTVTAEPGQAFTWQLQYGLGGDPQGSGWHTVASGSGSTSFSGTFGSLALSSIPQAFWARAFAATPTGLMTSIDEYTVTFRVVASDTGPGPAPLSDEARIAVTVFHDPTAVAGFPMQLASSGESQPALVDLQGSGRLDIVFGTADGYVDAIDPATGRELPGWPVHTGALTVAPLPAGSGIAAGDEPILANVAVGDLFDTGALDVVATSTSGRVYAFDAHGHPLAGWPKTLDAGVVPPAIPRPDDANVRLPVLGATAPPVLAPLASNGQLDVVQAAWNGDLYAWTPAGKPLTGWPVTVSLPKGTTPPANYVIEDDHKLDTPPAVAWFSKSGPPDLVIRSQYTEINPNESLQPIPFSFTFAYTAAGKLMPGWPVKLTGAIEDYGSAQEFITEGTDAPAAADVLGTGVDEIAVNPVWTPPYLVAGDGSVLGSYGNLGALANTLESLQANSLDAYEHKLPAGISDVPFPFSSSGSFGEVGGKLTFTQPEIGAESMGASLLYVGTENHINAYESAWPANVETASGNQQSGFPSAVQGQGFLADPIIADVSGGGTESVIVGGDASAVSAALPNGAEAPGFPKFTGGWTTYSPATGDLFGTGRTDLVTITREGELFAWSTPGLAGADDQWWRARHDEWNSGNYGLETRPPGVARDPVWVPGSDTVSFIAPGGTWYDGTVNHYVVTLATPAGHVTETRPATVSAGSLQSFTVPAGTTSVTVQARGPTGLLGGTVTITPGVPGIGSPLSGRVVGIAETPDGHGYWLVTSAGAVYAVGDAHYHGGVVAGASDQVVGIAATADGGGYWIATAKGQVTPLGDAPALGSVSTPLTKPVVGMAATPAGAGYWLVASDGGIFSFGAARFHGSTGAMHLNKPVVGMAPTADGNGYWLVASDGGVFTFGDAHFHGSTGGIHLNKPVVGMAAAPGGAGYWLVATDGGIFGFGAGFVGSAGGAVLPAPITSMAPTPGPLPGYRLAAADGVVYVFGPLAADA